MSSLYFIYDVVFGITPSSFRVPFLKDSVRIEFGLAN